MGKAQEELAEQNLTLMNYKEPLKKIPTGKGVGYYGAIICSKDGETIQCHECGGLYGVLDQHLRHAHSIKVRDYKIKYQLALSTALVSEAHRKRQKTAWLKWWNSLSKMKQEEYKKRNNEHLKEGQSNRSHFQPKIALETKNKRGTCPDQLLDRIQKTADKLGKVPTLKEFINDCGTQRYKHLVFTTFGSWKNALKMLDMKPDELIKKAPKELTLNGKPTYETEELLEYLRMFTEEEKKIPTMTDFHRGYLPSYDAYMRRFGGIERARQAAGVYEILKRKTQYD